MGKKVKSFLLCLDALRLLPRGLEIIGMFEEEIKTFQNESFLSILRKNPLFFVKIQTFVYFRFLVIQINKSRHWILRYDGRHLRHLDENVPLEVWLLDECGNLMERKFDERCLPRLHNNNYRHISKPTPLWQLLDLSESQNDPTTFEETMEFLATNDKMDVNVNFILAPGYGHKLHSWHSGKYCSKSINVFTLNTYSIGFASKLERKHSGGKHKKIEIIDGVKLKTHSEKDANRSSAVSVKLSGLNLAYSLGCISKDDFVSISNALAKLFITIWFEFDDKFNVRFTSLYTRSILFQKEIKSENDWTLVFNWIESQKLFLTTEKEKLLSSTFKKLQAFSLQTNSLYTKCERELQNCVKNLKIIVYSKDDEALHGLKLYLANFLKNKLGQKFRGVSLNGDARNNLILIKHKELTFFNLNMYLKSDLFPLDLLPTPNLKSNVKLLKNHVENGNLTILQQCKERGKVMAPHLLTTWQMIGNFFMENFEYDIYSYLFLSFAKLSYETVWSFYNKRAGIFHHGLEKTKIAYEKIFRSFCKGGFSYSAKEELKVGDPIHKSSGENAKSICEFDLISSYGYAGSQISVPKGFCIGYSDDGNGNLVCNEPYMRFNSFEFLSVYYTLWKIVNEKISVKTVYSNFHTSGLFYIGNFPLDLVVITDNGNLMLFQFDGEYAHGCKKGCGSLPSYVNGKSRQELEMKTKIRDEFIMHWTNEVNNFLPGIVTYEIKSNCHDKEYNILSLMKSFKEIEMLKNLSEGYFNKKILTYKEVLGCSDNLMYIMIAEGFIPSIESDINLPNALMVMQNNKWFRTHSNIGQPLMFTNDYSEWLIKTFNFQFTKIHKVFFYKKCTILNEIFKELTFLRMTPHLLPSAKQLIKMIINYTAGFFGFNQYGKINTKCTIISNFSKRKYDILKTKLEPLEGVCENEFFVKTYYKSPSKHEKSSLTGLPIFCSIVEYGKLRMSQILCLFDACFSPLSYRHLYSNVDNIVFVLSTCTLNDAVKPTMQSLFNESKQFFFQSNTPGHLKEEFFVNSNQNWKFVTAALMNYVLIADNFCVQKNSAFNNLSFDTAYNASLALLHNKTIVVEQTRRVCKMVNKNVETLCFTYNK